MSTNHPAGAQWNKWDLHVHTPCSIVQNYGGDTPDAWERFISDLEQLPKEFKVLGINDYIFVDGYEKLLNAKKDGRLTNIDLLLPVVELRLDKFAGVVKRGEDGTYSKTDWNRINIHIIFDQIDPDVIRQQFLTSLAPSYCLIPDSNEMKDQWRGVITQDSLINLGEMIIDSTPEGKRSERAAPLQEGFNNLCVSMDGVNSALDNHYLKNRFLIAIGKTEWDDMKWDGQFIAEKRSIINSVDLVFTASGSPEAYEKARKRLAESNVLDKLLDCSDAHAKSDSKNKDRIGNCFTWIKADATFQGLKQAITEFDQRVFVGDTPPKMLMINNNRTKYLDRIKIFKKPDSELSEKWFEVDIPLNQDLVAIIGNKGSGKSALADVIALAGMTKKFFGFSFLNDSRFRNPRGKLASNFVGKVLWCSGDESSMELDKNPHPSSVERVKYLPQSYLETLCNELAGGSSSTFDAELRKIIFTHVPDEQRIGLDSLDELLNFKVSELESERRQLVQEVSSINVRIADIEHKLSPGFRASLGEQLEAKRNELRALESAEPEPVVDPKDSGEAQDEAKQYTEQLSRLESQLAALAKEQSDRQAKRSQALKKVAGATRVRQAIKNHQNVHAQFIDELRSMLVDLGTDMQPQALARLTVDLSVIDELETFFREEAKTQELSLNDTGESGLISKRDRIELDIKTIKSKLGEQQRAFLLYREKIQEWELEKTLLIGNMSQKSSIMWLEGKLKQLDELPETLDQLRNERNQVVRDIHRQLHEILTEYKVLYEPVQKFVEEASQLEMSLPLSFKVKIAEAGFEAGFLGKINRQARGSFSGVEESERRIQLLLKETDFNDVDSLMQFLMTVDELLHRYTRNDGNEKVMYVQDQLRKDEKVNDVYDQLFSLQYLKPEYSLTFDGQEINQLSPGERGLLLLVFYLLVDKEDIPLIIDQPEENLDNQTIYKVLVSCIKIAKNQRQVIMVTHNPNLAVVCDAEQVIYAACDKVAKQFSYESGAIESPSIKARVIEILEGTEPAFVNRKLKYGI